MSSFDFTDKSVIVTGGGTGIGYEIAKSFLTSGSNVAIVGRRNDVLDNSHNQIKKEIPGSNEKIIAISCDMSNEQSVSDLFQTVQSTFNNIDILINNCGTWSLGSINELKDSEMDAHFNNILKSTILGTKLASAYFGESGAIVNVGSFAGILPMKNASIYSSLKSAINSDWERLDQFVKLSGFVNCKSDFTNHPQIINGASDLLIKIFGEHGKHSRFAVGSNSLPMNCSVEIDAIIKIR